MAIAALVTAVIALVIAIIVTIVAVAVLGGAGGELSEVFREYAACLESNSQAECRALLEQSLNRIVG
jgi:ABC-type transport system involved in multi-copper enzyme maturation permease subunit